MMRLTKSSVCILVASAFYVAPAQAQATRTWVSGTGSDANACSRFSPCQTIGVALEKVQAGGEINCIDAGGFGGFTITKSVTIDCSGTAASILATSGIQINDSSTAFPGTIRVIIRGLTILGNTGNDQDALGNPGQGTTGINFVSGASLTVDNVVIERYNAGIATGINFRPSGAAQLSVHHSVITDNGSGGAGGGIVIHPTGAGSAVVSLSDVTLLRNAAAGLSVDTTGNTGAAGITVAMHNVSIANGNAQGISVLTPSGTTRAALLLKDVTISGNAYNGIFANGSGAVVRVGDSTITGNYGGIQGLGGAQILTFGNNQLVGNPTAGVPNNGVFSGPVPPS